MSIPLTNFTPIQVRALASLGDRCSDPDGIGREMSELPDALLIAAYELSKIGLVEASLGWRGTVWFRLTTLGRALLETGH